MRNVAEARVVLLLAFAGSAITYLDRAAISAAAPRIMPELGPTPGQMGFVSGIFQVSYGLFEIPMGWLGDRVGQRIMLTRIVASWSAFTALTGAAWSYTSLAAIRFLFGAVLPTPPYASAEFSTRAAAHGRF